MKEMSDREFQDRLQEEISKAQERQNLTGVSSYIHTNAGTFPMGTIFEAETVHGNKNYVVFFFSKEGWVYYCHGDKAKKVREDQFQKLIDYGDLVPIPREKADPEKLSLSVLGLKAMSEGLAFGDYMRMIWGYGTGSEAPKT